MQFRNSVDFSKFHIYFRTSRLNLFLRNDALSDKILSTDLVIMQTLLLFVINIIQAKSLDQNLNIVPLADKGNITGSLVNWDHIFI